MASDLQHPFDYRSNVKTPGFWLKQVRDFTGDGFITAFVNVVRRRAREMAQ